MSDVRLSRRQFLTAAGAGAATVGLAACGSSGSKSSSTTAGSSASSGTTASSPTSTGGSSKAATVSFVTWAGAAEETAFKQLVAKFEETNPNIKIDLQIVPYTSVLSDINARLQAGSAPDLFRVTYTDIGIYSSKQSLLDLGPYLPSDFATQFDPAYYAAIEFDGKPYGIPHQTDTTALLYNTELLAAAGVGTVPDTLAGAWSWEEFLAVAKKVQAKQPSGKYAFMYDWAQTGAFRWLSWLFEAGGNLLEKDLKTPAINSAAGIKAVEFTQSFFSEGLVPKDTSTGNQTYPDTLFSAGTIAMAFAADFLLPGDIVGGAKFDYAATFQPRDVAASSDLGGNAIVATKDSKSPEAAATFLQFMASRESMSTFCALTNELPTRQDLAGADIPYAVAPTLMKTFVAQATTLTPFQVQQVTVPTFNAINTNLQNQLDAAFVGGQSAATTVKNIASSISSSASAGI